MTKAIRFDVELLPRLVIYDPEVGSFTWKPRGPEWFVHLEPRSRQRAEATWNTRYANKRGFTAVGSHGYYCSNISINGKVHHLLAHIVAWAIQTGAWPTRSIDHWDRDKLNNRFKNLRHAGQSFNTANSAPKSRKYKGVQPTQSGRYVAKVMKNYKYICLGTYDTAEEAARAYDRGVVQAFGPYAKTNF